MTEIAQEGTRAATCDNPAHPFGGMMKDQAAQHNSKSKSIVLQRNSRFLSTASTDCPWAVSLSLPVFFPPKTVAAQRLSRANVVVRQRISGGFSSWLMSSGLVRQQT